MKKKLIVGLIVVIVLVGIPLAVYATDYAGEYNMTVTFSVVSPAYSEVDVLDFEVGCAPMELMSFWALKGRGGSTLGNYTVFVEVTQGSDVDCKSQSVLVLYPYPYAERVDMVFSFQEKQVGETDVRVYIEHVYTSTVVFDNTWEVNVA